MTVRQIEIFWKSPGATDGTSVLHFDATVPVATQRTALGVMLNSIKASIVSGATITVATQGREFDETTGTLTGLWVQPTVLTYSGAATLPPVSNVSQVLMRVNTGVVINGRFVLGHVYIPGLSSSFNTLGEVASSTQTGFAGYFNTMSAASSFVVWHRPKAGAAGSLVSPSTISTWNEFAVLRKRR